MRKSILVIGVLVALCISGCTQDSRNNADKSGPSVPEEQSIAESPDWTILVAVSRPVTNKSGGIQAETAGFTIYIPKGWAVVSLELLEDGHKVAELLPVQRNDIYINLIQK